MFYSDVKEKFVSAIKSGLSETQAQYSYSNKRINNARHFVKMDNIANSVIDTFKHNTNLDIITLQRGGYTLILIYDALHDILYSLMSSRRFKELLDRDDHSKVHYLDALVNFNDTYDRNQLVIDETFFKPEFGK